MPALFKILTASAWREAQDRGHLPWSAKDRADGFVHLSAPDQVRETAERHFAGQVDLILVELEAAELSSLRWEPSRGGALFPHVYADVPLSAVSKVHALVDSVPGAFTWPKAVSPGESEEPR